jgi:hypothetical protein
MMNISLGASPLRAPPKTVLCYVCGRAYGLASINIHITACEKKFLAEQHSLPVRERKPLPKAVDYSALAAGGHVSEAAAEAINEAARKQADSLLSPCAWCGRTFNPERLEIHNRSCTQERPARRLLSGMGTAGGAGGGSGVAQQELEQAPPLPPPRRAVSALGGARRRNTLAGDVAAPPFAATAASLSAGTADSMGGGGGERSGNAPRAQQQRASAAGGAHAACPGVVPGAAASKARTRLAQLAQKLSALQEQFTAQCSEISAEMVQLAAELGV